MIRVTIDHLYESCSIEIYEQSDTDNRKMLFSIDVNHSMPVSVMLDDGAYDIKAGLGSDVVWKLGVTSSLHWSIPFDGLRRGLFFYKWSKASTKAIVNSSLIQNANKVMTWPAPSSVISSI